MSDKESFYHKAGWVVAKPGAILENAYVKVEAGKIVDVAQGRIPRGGKSINYGPGAIVPGLINAHTHLELCALRGLVPCESGFRNWVIKLLEERLKLNRKTIVEYAKKGILQMQKSGCAAAGDISTLGYTWGPFSESTLAGVWFKEYIGNLNSDDTRQILASTSKRDPEKMGNGNIIGSMAIHGPHTTAPELVAKILGAARENNLPVSVHLAESEDEIEFVTTGKGHWADFLSFRGIRFSHWNLPSKSPVQYLERIGALSGNIIGVHLLHLEEKDIDILVQRQVKACLCPRSNRNLHGLLPDLPALLDAGLKPCLGTDSPASCDSLSIFDEMAFAARNFESVSPFDIFAMATINGAEALGIADRLGTLIPKKDASLVYVPVEGNLPEQVLERIVNGDIQKPIKKIATV